MAKRLSVVVSSPASEVAKNLAIIAAQTADPSLQSNAPEIRRDANGKVTEVIITLPDSAATAAAAAISATPGVASVATGDIVPGTQGDDGTLAGKQALEAAGFTYTVSGPDPQAVITETYLPTGIVQLDFPSTVEATLNIDSSVSPALPAGALPFEVEMKCEFSNLQFGVVDGGIAGIVTNGGIRVVWANQWQGNNARTALFAWDANGGHFATPALAIPVGMHIYTLKWDGTTLSALVDGAVVASHALVPTNGGYDNKISVQYNGHALDGISTPQILVDYARWTKP